MTAAPADPRDPASPVDLAEDALATVLAALAAYRRLVGQITYQVTGNHISSGGAVVEIRRLLAAFEDSGSSAGGQAGSSPAVEVDVGPDQPNTYVAPTSARHAATNTPDSGVPGTQLQRGWRQGADWRNQVHAEQLTRVHKLAAGWVNGEPFDDEDLANAGRDVLVALGEMTYDARPVSPAGPVTDWVPTTHHYGPGDVIPTVDPALTDTPTVDGGA